MWISRRCYAGTPFVQKNTVYAIELNTTVKLEEWSKDICIMLEEAGFLVTIL
jgi:hypothetical protein